MPKAVYFLILKKCLKRLKFFAPESERAFGKANYRLLVCLLLYTDEHL